MEADALTSEAPVELYDYYKKKKKIDPSEHWAVLHLIYLWEERPTFSLITPAFPVSALYTWSRC